MPFKTPAAPQKRSLALVNTSILIININGYEISSSTNNLTKKDGKEGKLGFLIPQDIDLLMHHLNNFEFLILFFLKESSYLNTQWQIAIDILEDGRLFLQEFT